MQEDSIKFKIYFSEKGGCMPKEEQLKKLLKENGLKITTQRIAILQVLSNGQDKHLTAEEIYDCVRTTYPDIGLATVYRTIQALAERKLIEKLNLDDGHVRYEISKKESGRNIHHHHHLVCLKCGKVLSFQDDLLEELENRIKNTQGFHVTDHEVKLFGYCNHCMSKKDVI